jgi:hypothetical protein
MIVAGRWLAKVQRYAAIATADLQAAHGRVFAIIPLTKLGSRLYFHR